VVTSPPADFERVADIEPLDVDGVHTIAVGSVLWLIALLALLPFLETLRNTDRLWWLWTCGAGLGIGLIGFVYCRRRRNAIRRQPGNVPIESSQFGAAG